MKFIGGTAAARKLFEDLYREGLLCMPYQGDWIRNNAEKLEISYEHYQRFVSAYPNDKGLVFIDTSDIDIDRLQQLFDIFPSFGQIYRTDTMMVNPDIIVLNLNTQKMMLFGLGRRDRIFTYIFVDDGFEYVSGSTLNEFLDESFETINEESNVAVDPACRYLQEICSDFCQLIEKTYNSLKAYGEVNFEYMSLPLAPFEIENALANGPNSAGVYDVDGEEMTSEDLQELQQQYENLGETCRKYVESLQILFPKIEQGQLATGAY